MPNDIIPYDPNRQLEKPKKRTLFPLPSVTDDGSRICVKLNIPNIPAHRQAFIGAIYNLTRWYSWEQDEAHTAREIATVWKGVFNDFLNHFYDGCPEDADCRQCLDFLPEYPLIKYYPNDPFRTPDYTPPGYVLPPWYTNAGVPLPGVLPTDAMVNLLSLAEIPIAALAEGMPRFDMHVAGVGELELEFVKVPQGGYALIYSDSTTPQTRLINLQSVSVVDAVSLGTLLAILGLPGDYDIVQSEVVELKFTTPGDHYVLCTFIPAVGGEAILGFGGGLRRVGLCGLNFDGANAMGYFKLRQNPDNSCLLEQQIAPEGAWSTAFDFSLCSPGSGVTPEEASLRCRYAEGVVNEFWVKHARPFFASISNSRQAEETFEDALLLAKGAWGWTFSSTYDVVFQSLFETFWEWPTTPPPPDLPTYIDALDGNGLDDTKKVFYNSMNEHGDIDDESIERFRVAMQSLYDAEIPTAEWDFFEAAFATAWLINKPQVLGMLPNIAAGYTDTDCDKFASNCFVITVLGTDDPKDTGIDVAEGDLFLGSVFGLTAYEADGERFDAAGDDEDESSGKVLSGAPRSALIGRIGASGDWFLIGTNTFLTIATNGRLYLAINDVTGDYADNTGSLTISPCVYRAPVEGCELTTWVVQVGNEVSRTDSSITVDAVVLGSDFVVVVNSPGSGIDCCKMSYELISGTNPTSVGAINCAAAQEAGNILFSYTGATPVNYYNLAVATSGNTAFRVKIKGI